jgi:hypothetical protein
MFPSQKQPRKMDEKNTSGKEKVLEISYMSIVINIH